MTDDLIKEVNHSYSDFQRNGKRAGEDDLVVRRRWLGQKLGGSCMV